MESSILAALQTLTCGRETGKKWGPTPVFRVATLRNASIPSFSLHLASKPGVSHLYYYETNTRSPTTKLYPSSSLPALG